MCTPNPCKNPTPVCEAAGDGLNYTCSCNETSCGAGKTCVGGTCYNCEKGEKCDCSGNQVSDGNGGCYTPNDSCNPNPCPSETPSCSALDETQYSCSCTSDSCPDGKECSDMACQNCSAGDDCGCSDYGKEADGNGGCRCPGMKIDDGKGGCRCPDCYVATTNWGECKKTCECVTCAKAKKCVEGECINCPLGEDCGCSDDDAYSNGSGVCEPNDPCAKCPVGSVCLNEKCECPPNSSINTLALTCEDKGLLYGTGVYIEGKECKTCKSLKELCEKEFGKGAGPTWHTSKNHATSGVYYHGKAYFNGNYINCYSECGTHRCPIIAKHYSTVLERSTTICNKTNVVEAIAHVCEGNASVFFCCEESWGGWNSTGRYFIP